MLGLLLLPSDFRAGAETAHGHALLHLWLDAVDGAVHHHHGPGVQDAAWDWLEPAVAVAGEPGIGDAGATRPDVGEHQDSAPVGGGVHLLVKSVVLLILATARSAPPAAPRFTLTGQAVPVLLPPPRWTPLAG